MSRSWLRLWSVFASFLVAMPWTPGATFAVQEFTFLGRTSGSNPLFWIAEDIGGEASQSYLLLLSAKGDTATLAKVDLKRMKEWGWLKDGMVHFETEEAIALFERDGKWTTGQAPWYIQAPEYSEELVAVYEAHVRQYNGQNLPAWLRDQGAKAIQGPRVSNMKAALVYAYPSGLYVDYSISSACYFPKSGYLLVFTKQKRLAVGMDTMHGFLLLRRAE